MKCQTLLFGGKSVIHFESDGGWKGGGLKRETRSGGGGAKRETRLGGCQHFLSDDTLFKFHFLERQRRNKVKVGRKVHKRSSHSVWSI